MNCYLLIDFGSTYTKLTLVDVENCEIISTSKSITTIETNILDGYYDALSKISDRNQYNIVKTLACSSAAGGLKIAVIGNVKELTVAAAKKAALGAGAKITKSYSFTLNNSEIEELKGNDVDLILLSGGTDGGNREYIINNALKLSKSNIETPIVYAGNKSCIDEVKTIFSNQNNVYYTENIMPVLNEVNDQPVRETIREVFMKHIIYAKGIDKAMDLVDNDIIPTPLSVLLSAETLACGTDNIDGIGDLIIIDVGGATTDVHSICKGHPSRGDISLKGLEEPFSKRTVEGDLGMRYSAESLLQSVKAKAFKDVITLDTDAIYKEIDNRHKTINFVPSTEFDYEFDEAMAKLCVKESMTRHSGEVFTTPTPFGDAYYQLGKDLTTVQTVIGTGGVIVHSKDYKSILKYCKYNTDELTVLKPRNPKLLLDKEYILSAFGLISIENNDLAYDLLTKYIKEVL